MTDCHGQSSGREGFLKLSHLLDNDVCFLASFCCTRIEVRCVPALFELYFAVSEPSDPIAQDPYVWASPGF